MDYVSYLISNNQTNDALDYLYSLLTERRNHLQSKRFVFRAYKNNIANIDKTSYDETKEIKLLDELINSDVPVITAKYIKDNRFKKIDGSDDLIKTNAIVENQSLDEGSDMEKAKELHSIAYEFWREEEYKDAQTLFNKAYNMGWAPSKTIGKSEPIDNDFSDKITGYVIYQAKNNKTNDGIRYLYGLLVNRSDSQSVQNIFNAYKNSLPAIDKTVYDESLELELLEKMIHNGDNYFFEAEKLKNERYRKALFSDKLVKK